jgi:hypothetical protein
LAGWIGEYRWKWMIDLLVANLLAVLTVIVLVRILRPADDLFSVVVVATLFHLVPAVTVNLALFVLMTLIDSGRNHG